MEEQGGHQGIEDEAGGLQGAEQGQRQGGDLDRGADDVAEQEEQHAELPSSAAEGGAAREVVGLFVFQHVRLALQSQADGLDACRHETDDDAQLRDAVRAAFTGRVYNTLTPRVAPGDSDAMIYYVVR